MWIADGDKARCNSPTGPAFNCWTIESYGAAAHSNKDATHDRFAQRATSTCELRLLASKGKIVPTSNASIYKQISEEAYSKMVRSSSESRRPKGDGTEGFIITYDPSQTSFKQSMIVVVFTGMWLEAVLHQQIVSKHGEHTFQKYDFKPYRDKLVLLDVADSALLDDVDTFKSTRKELVHEKALFDSGDIRVAQTEAELAHRIMERVSSELGC